MKTVFRGLVASSAVVFFLLVAGGTWFFFAQEKYLHRKVDEELESIAALKVRQIVLWRQKRLADASVISNNPLVTGPLVQWFAAPNQALSDHLRAWFRALQKYYHYFDILLVDAGGEVRLSLSEQSPRLNPGILPVLDEAIRTHLPVLSDLHRMGEHGTPHQDTFVPIFSAGQGKVVGSIVLRSDANDFLFPMIQDWPGHSRSAETLLVRRDGDQVLFLNQLRHQKNTALRLRMPLANLELPASRAVKGERGVTQGRDYRGIEVLSVLSAIPDTPWFMVTKIDAVEALAEWKARSLLILGLLFGLGAALFAGLGLTWQRYAKKQYRAALRAEEERRYAEAQYRTTLMSVGDGVIACDSEGRVTLLNPVAEVLSGWAQDEARGKSIEEVFVIVNEDTRFPVENPVMRVLREGIVVGLANHTILIAPDGREFPIADSGAPIFDEQGRMTGVVLVFRDQTEERRTESVLRRSNRLLVRAEAMANMGCWEFDFKSRTVWASPSARRIYGLNEEIWTIEAVQAIPLPEYRHALNRALRGLVDKGEVYDIEFRIQRPTDGVVVDIHSQAEFFPEEEKIFGIIQDITARKQAEATLVESESRYRSLFHNSRAVMWLIDPEDGLILDVNPAATRFYGWSREQLLNMRVGDINMLSAPELKEAMEDVLSDRRDCFEFRHRLADGSIRDVEVFPGAIRVEGQDCLYSIIHDITERKQAEEQQKHLQAQLLQAHKLESVGRLAGGVAHDLNNLLSPILGYGDVLLAELAETDKHRDYVGYILQAGMRARDLIRQLLAFGRKQALVMEIMDLNGLTSGFANLLRRTVREDIAIEMIPAPTLPSVRVDIGQIEQVLMNLVVNAQDAMPAGGKILIETAALELDQEYADAHAGVTPGSYAVLTVTDTGFGMEAETCDQIFTPFFTTKEKGKGTGLGLATTYGIIRQHGGHIWVYSEPGQGTTFKIYLPAAESAPEPKPPEPTVAPPLRSGSETVMVVEDNDMVRQLTVEILSRRGYTVLEASRGEECLRQLAELSQPPDLLITDVVMPEMNGKMLYKQAALLIPGLKVLYMSGYTENVIASRGVLDEGVNFIQKPFAPNALTVKVREILER